MISLHHQLLTASAHPRHCSRMQCIAGVRKTAQLHFRIHLVPDPGSQIRCKSSAVHAGARLSTLGSKRESATKSHTEISRVGIISLRSS